MNRFATLFTLLSATMLAQCSTLNSPAAISTEVGVTTGMVRGLARDDQGVLAFKGIPYAAPPTGELRWRPPQSPASWQGVRDALDFGNRCIPSFKGGFVPHEGPQSEDCLSLNVWTAAVSRDERRPVMVWIHGGGFQFGASNSANINGVRLAAKGVVLVSLNYRLGVFGFLAYPELDAEGTPSGNFGLQDQLQALKWVKQNIAQFGGDPDNVTIFGESAGAMSVGLLTASPLARGLFHRAIGESGAFWDGPEGSISTHAEALLRGSELAERLTNGNLAELRSIPAETLGEEAGWDFGVNPVAHAFSPSIDGYVVPDTPANLYAQGKQNDVSLLAGWNGEEGILFKKFALPHGSSAEFLSSVENLIGPENLDEFLQFYPSATDAEAARSAVVLAGDLTIAQQVWEWLQRHRKTASSAVYGYQYDYRSAYSPLPVHVVEIDFVFGTLTPQRLSGGKGDPGPRDHELAEQMMSYWTNFARTGNPNGPGLPDWPAYEVQDPHTMMFTTQSSAPAAEGLTDRFRFWSEFRGPDGRLPASWKQIP